MDETSCPAFLVWCSQYILDIDNTSGVFISVTTKVWEWIDASLPKYQYTILSILLPNWFLHYSPNFRYKLLEEVRLSFLSPVLSWTWLQLVIQICHTIYICICMCVDICMCFAYNTIFNTQRKFKKHWRRKGKFVFVVFYIHDYIISVYYTKFCC